MSPARTSDAAYTATPVPREPGPLQALERLSILIRPHVAPPSAQRPTRASSHPAAAIHTACASPTGRSRASPPGRAAPGRRAARAAPSSTFSGTSGRRGCSLTTSPTATATGADPRLSPPRRPTVFALRRRSCSRAASVRVCVQHPLIPLGLQMYPQVRNALSRLRPRGDAPRRVRRRARAGAHALRRRGQAVPACGPRPPCAAPAPRPHAALSGAAPPHPCRDAPACHPPTDSTARPPLPPRPRMQPPPRS